MREPAPTILIIDNDDGLVRALQTRLESVGYRCVTASSGAQGLAEFRTGSVDLIVSDLNMPAGDGVALAGSVRELGDVPIVIITGFHDEFRRELRSISNVTLFKKPFDWNALLEVIDAELAMRGVSLP